LKFILIILIAASSIPFLLNGCVPSKPIDEIELLPSERLINKLEANRRKIKNFEGVGVIKIESEMYDNSASFRVIMKKPDSVYFTIMGPFGIELAQSLVTEDTYIFYDALENTAYTGEVNENVLRDIFKINLSFTDLLDAFVGSVNLTRNLYKQPDDYLVDGEEYVLTYNNAEDGVTTKYRVDIRELGITNYSIKSSADDVDLQGNYSGFELIENVAIPFEIEVINKIENQKIKINYSNIVVNNRSLFVNFTIPNDASIVEW
jgi:outer membrane lipoprotein-sorting protein